MVVCLDNNWITTLRYFELKYVVGIKIGELLFRHFAPHKCQTTSGLRSLAHFVSFRLILPAFLLFIYYYFAVSYLTYLMGLFCNQNPTAQHKVRDAQVSIAYMSLIIIICLSALHSMFTHHYNTFCSLPKPQQCNIKRKIEKSLK